MAVYRFRVQIDDYDDIYRDIDILPHQTFEDFHQIIQEAFNFDNKHAASFFTSDDYWRKGEEITLREEDLALDEDDRRKNISKKYLMSKTKISTFVSHPHQRFLYIFDPNVRWEFMIELIKILSEETENKYPFISRKVGNPPKQYKAIPKETNGLQNPELNLLGLLKPDEINEDDIYKAIADENFEIPMPDEEDDKIAKEFSEGVNEDDLADEGFEEEGEDDEFSGDFHSDEDEY